MFKKEYVFYGSHAFRVQSLVAKFSDFSGATLFQRNVDVLLFAPIVGFLFKRTSKIDKSTNDSTKIFIEQMIREDIGIRHNYQLITLLDNENKVDKDHRINAALKNIEDESEEIDRYNQYILGGIDILYEKLIEPSKVESDYLNNLYEFLSDLNNRYYREFEDENILEIIELARE